MKGDKPIKFCGYMINPAKEWAYAVILWNHIILYENSYAIFPSKVLAEQCVKEMSNLFPHGDYRMIKVMVQRKNKWNRTKPSKKLKGAR